MHAHSDPDGTPRSIDSIDLARLAKSRGMRGLVLKNHYEPTASLAYIVRKEVPGIEIFGGISLDLTVGGVNPAAVEWMTKVKGGYGRVVWMPTYDSEAQVKLTKHQQRPFARVSMRLENWCPKYCRCMAIAARKQPGARGRAFLPGRVAAHYSGGEAPGGEACHGHARADQSGQVRCQSRKSRRLPGWARISNWFTPRSMTSRCGRMWTRSSAPRDQNRSSYRAISGQPANPLHPDGLLAMYRALMAHGVSEAEIVQMSRTNPARLLDLQP